MMLAAKFVVLSLGGFVFLPAVEALTDTIAYRANASNESNVIPCHTARESYGPFARCNVAVVWAMSVGLQTRPQWYPGLSATSTFEEFQARLSNVSAGGDGGAACPPPCSGHTTSVFVGRSTPFPQTPVSTPTPSDSLPPAEPLVEPTPTAKGSGLPRSSTTVSATASPVPSPTSPMATPSPPPPEPLSSPPPASSPLIPAPSTNSSAVPTSTKTPPAALCQARAANPSLPPTPTSYNGISWPAYCFEGDNEEHVFIIGDWGGRRGHGRHVHPADNTKDHEGRGFAGGIDDRAQEEVASRMRHRALVSEPRYVLNVGDNFYWGGIDEDCGRTFGTFGHTGQWRYVYEAMYTGTGLSDRPWFSVLGNHDYGGFKFKSAWDQQIGYTWGPGGRWLLPGLYWHQHVDYPSKNFSVDYYMVDTNILDAKHPYHDPVHNICSRSYNHGKGCAPFGPKDPWDCKRWFERLWQEQLRWLESKLEKSTATWQIVVTHFPPEERWFGSIWRRLVEKYGIDLFVVGHRHQQELRTASVAGAPYAVSGGGGGVTSERNPLSWGGQDQYGYMDMTLKRTSLFIQAFNQRGHLRRTMTVFPKDGWHNKQERVQEQQEQHEQHEQQQQQQQQRQQQQQLHQQTLTVVFESEKQVSSTSCDGMGDLVGEIPGACGRVFEGAQVTGVLIIEVNNAKAFVDDPLANVAVEAAIAKLADVEETRDVSVGIVPGADEVQDDDASNAEAETFLSRRLAGSILKVTFSIEVPKEDTAAHVSKSLGMLNISKISDVLQTVVGGRLSSQYHIRAVRLDVDGPFVQMPVMHERGSPVPALTLKEASSHRFVDLSIGLLAGCVALGAVGLFVWIYTVEPRRARRLPNTPSSAASSIAPSPEEDSHVTSTSYRPLEITDHRQLGSQGSRR